MNQNRILVITRNLPPLVGGMERLVWNIVKELSTSYNVSVIGPRGCRLTLPENINTIELPVHSLLCFLLLSTLTGIKGEIRFRPHVVFAGSGLAVLISWLISRLVGSKCVVYLHGLDIVTNHFIYRLIWRPIFKYCDLVIVNSRFTRQSALKAGIKKERIVILHPGVDLPNMAQKREKRAEFRSRHSLGDSPLILYVGRITPRKGLSYFCQRILPKIIAQIPDVLLVVIGDDASNALLKFKGELLRTKNVLDALNIRNQIVFLGEVSDPELSSAYFAADVLIFPILARLHDNEGFGMVAIEAAAHGLHTVAFAAGGVPDAVMENISGRLIDQGEDGAFAQAVVNILSVPANTVSSENARRFAMRFEWSLFGAKLRLYISKLIESNNCNQK